MYSRLVLSSLIGFLDKGRVMDDFKKVSSYVELLFKQVELHLLDVGCFIIISVVHVFYDGVSVMPGETVVGEQGI